MLKLYYQTTTHEGNDKYFVSDIVVKNKYITVNCILIYDIKNTTISSVKSLWSAAVLPLKNMQQQNIDLFIIAIH